MTADKVLISVIAMYVLICMYTIAALHKIFAILQYCELSELFSGVPQRSVLGPIPAYY